jgi:hypothetical protein
MNIFRQSPTIDRYLLLTASLFFGSRACAGAQDPTGTIEGPVVDTNGLTIAAARITLDGHTTGVHRELQEEPNRQFRFSALLVDDYALTLDFTRFAKFVKGPISLSVGDAIRIDAKLRTATLQQSVDVQTAAESIDLATNDLGKTVTQREIVDLPLNGRNFAQLGLLQTGVAPLTNGLLTEDGSLRAGQSYVVNGQKPEANNFILDGAQNVDRTDGGFAPRIPIDALQEFRILTATASPEYGGNTAPSPPLSRAAAPRAIMTPHTRSHAAVTSRLMDEATVAAVLRDLDTALIHEADKLLLRFTRKVTEDSANVTAKDTAALRDAGWSDAAIYYAISINALFNFYNRWVSASGVHAVSHEAHKTHGATIAERGYVRA